MAYRDPAEGRRKDRDRTARLTAARTAAGLCTRCGKTEPLPARRLCAPCNEKRNAATPSAGPPAFARSAAGLRRAPGARLCEPCAEQHRARDRARHARTKAEGIPYGGRDPEARRRAGRERSLRRSEARKAAGLCIRCGNVPPGEGRAMCEPCREDQAAGETRRAMPNAAPPACASNCATPCARREDLLRSRAPRPAPGAGTSRRSARPTVDAMPSGAPGAIAPVMRKTGQRGGRVPGLLRCCPRSLRRPTGCRGLRQVPDPHLRRDGLLHALRRRQGRAAATARRNTPPGAPGTQTGGPGVAASSATTPSPGVARCEPCSRKHREGSGAFRGIPLWDPGWTVIEIATGREHGPYDSEADVALCLAFEKLERATRSRWCVTRVPMSSTFTAPPW